MLLIASFGCFVIGNQFWILAAGLVFGAVLIIGRGAFQCRFGQSPHPGSASFTKRDVPQSFWVYWWKKSTGRESDEWRESLKNAWTKNKPQCNDKQLNWKKKTYTRKRNVNLCSCFFIFQFRLCGPRASRLISSTAAAIVYRRHQAFFLHFCPSECKR